MSNGEKAILAVWSLIMLIQVTLITLKVMNIIDWNWILVALPFIIIFIGGLLVAVLGAILSCVVSGKIEKQKEIVKHDQYYEEEQE